MAKKDEKIYENAVLRTIEPITLNLFLFVEQEIIESGELLEITKGIQAKNTLGCLAVKDLFGDFLKTLISNSVLR